MNGSDQPDATLTVTWMVCPAIRRSPGPRHSTLAEERQEVLESVAAALRVPSRDGDCRAACVGLLRHLARTAA